jgi:hypothetical protein
MLYKIALFTLVFFLTFTSTPIVAQPKDSITKQQQLNRIKKEKLRTPVKISKAQNTTNKSKLTKRKKTKNRTISKRKYRSGK